MASWDIVLISSACTLIIFVTGVATDQPCAARQISGRSVVCVCNDTYCDDVTRDAPATDQYVTYTSSEAGLRFKKNVGKLKTFYLWNETASHTLKLDPSLTHQTIEGFGGAVTDAAGIHYANLTTNLKKHFTNSYFSKNGLEYNMLRVPIGGSDFSTHVYAYNELPVNDAKLTNFSLAPEDFQYKIPLIKNIMSVSTAPIHIVATTWSPPPWMKTNEKFTGPSAVKPEYFQTYADYHAKFIREYKKNGIDIWGITTTNEPQNAYIPLIYFQSLGWSPSSMGKWIVENLGPTIRNATDLRHVKIMTVDDQRFTIPFWFNVMITERPEVLDFIDGVAVHFYSDKYVPAEVLELVTKKHPTKFVISTEASQGSYPWVKEKVALGDWSRAKDYINDIITDLNYDLIGWIDWNLCLNKQGGPNWAGNFVDAAILVYPETKEFVKQPMFYALGHIAKFIPRGSVRITVEETKGFLQRSLRQVAFVTPRNTIVVVIHNDGDAKNVAITLRGKRAVLDLEKHSITTVELDYTL